MSQYPNDIDNDETLPRVLDSVSEIGAAPYNALKEAILAIQNAIGADPQGAVADLVTRLSVSLNDNGTLKASAIIAAGLVALPIDNSQVASNAGIEESKLDLDVGTQALQNQITSNDIDITALQQSITSLLADFTDHVTGADFQHDGYQILLDLNFPSSPPPWLTGISATDVSTALALMNDRFLAHISTVATDAHNAANVSVDSGSFSTIVASNVQEALEDLEDLREVALDRHRDDMHANGISAWENDPDGYNLNNRLFPTSGLTASVTVISNLIVDLSLTVADLLIEQGSVLVIGSNLYQVADVGPRTGFGSKPTLTSSQVELLTPLAASSGALTAAIFGASSVSNLKVGLAATIYQGDAAVVDGIQLARPNAAKVVSLGADPNFITGTGPTLFVDVGVGEGLTRSVSISDLHFDRSGAPATTVTLDTIIQRINAVFQNGTTGNHFPAAAYRIGDEVAIVHNWSGSEHYWIRIRSTGTGAADANRFLGFDSDGANVLDLQVKPSRVGRFWVGGNQFGDFTTIFSATASVAAQTFTVSEDPIVAGVRIGQLLHMVSADVTADIGTYIITSVSSSSITVHQPGGITVDGAVEIVIDGSGVTLNDLNNSGSDILTEIFVDSRGRTGYSARLRYPDTIANVAVVDASDSLRDNDTLSVVASGSDRIISFGTTGTSKTVRSTLAGRIRIFGSSNVDWIDLELQNPIGTGTSAVVVDKHIDEEDLLELCTVKFDGIQSITHINDKRLFGSTGLDELREDVVQAYVETPTADLRSSGTVYGFDIEFVNVAAPSPYPTNTKQVFFKGGSAYVYGARVVTNGQYVAVPPVADTYFVCLDALARYSLISITDFSLEEVLDGLAGPVIPIAQVVHDGTSMTSATSLAYKIGNLDAKVDFILDLTNHQIGNFDTVEAAISYINSYPSEEKYRLRIVSHTSDAIEISGLTRDAVIHIDGSVGDLTISSNCELVADSRDRAAHVGSLTITSDVSKFTATGLRLAETDVTIGSGSVYEFSNCVFTSDVEFSDGTLSYLGFKNCVFEGDSGIQFLTGFGVGVLDMVGCRVVNLTAPMQLGGQYTRVSDTTWDTAGFEWNGAGSDDALIVSNCLFKNMTITTTNWCVSADNGRVILSDTIFENIVRTSGSLLLLDTNSYHTLTDVQFRTLTLSGTANPIIDFRGEFHGAVFADLTASHTGALLTAGSVKDTQVLTVGQRIATVIASHVSGVGRIEPPSWYDSTAESHTVSDCVLNVTSSVGVGLTPVTGSRFSGNTLSAESGSGVILLQIQDVDAARIIISENRFFELGSGGTIDAIDFGSATGNFSTGGIQIHVIGNLFENIVPFATNSAPISAVNISDNQLGYPGDNLSAFTLELADGCIVSNNRGHKMTITGNTTGLMIVGNAMELDDTAGIALSGAHEHANILDNFSGLTFDGTLTSSNIQGNRGFLFESDTGAFFDKVLISGNHFTNFDLSNYTIGKVSISDNHLFASNVTITMNGIVTVESNICETSDWLISGTVDGFIFRDNVNVNGDITSIVFSTSIQNIVVSNNAYFGLLCSDVVSNAIFDSNFAPSASFDFTGGFINAMSISENFLNSIDMSAADGGRISIVRNVIYDSLSFATTPGYQYTTSVIANNTVNGDINIGVISGDDSGGNTKTIRDLIVSDNICAQLVMLDGFETGNMHFQDSVVSDNVCDVVTIATNVDAGYTGSNFRFSDNVFSGNRLGTLSIGGGDLGVAANRLTYSRCVVTNNVIANYRAGGDERFNTIVESQFETFTVSGNTFFTFAMFMTASEGIVITNNTFIESCEFFTNAVDDSTAPLNSFVFSSNITSDLNVDFKCTTGVESFGFFPAAVYGDFVLSNNRLRAFRFLIDDESDKSVSQFNVSDNVFSGELDDEYPGMYVECAGNTFTSRYFGFSNNTYPAYAEAARLEFSGGINTGMEASLLSFDSNKGIDLVIECNSGMYPAWFDISISNNLFESSVEPAGFSLANCPSGEFSGVTFNGNVGGILDLQNISLSQMLVTGNNMRNSLTSSSINFDGCSISTMMISNNYTREITALNLGSSNGVVISDNMIGTTISEDVTWGGTDTVNNMAITGNHLLGDFIFTSALNDVNDVVFASNRGNRFTVANVDSVEDLVVMGNDMTGSIDLSADILTNAIVVGNRSEDLDLEGDEIVRLVCIGNLAMNRCILPTAITVFTSGTSQSKIIGCYADEWVCNGGAFDTDGQTNLFVFGNTSGAASTGPVTFTGTVGLTITNTNNAGGGGITVT